MNSASSHYKRGEQRPATKNRGSVVDRRAALLAGLTRYYTGKPCKSGHVAERYVSTWQCVECLRERQDSGQVAARRAEAAAIAELVGLPLLPLAAARVAGSTRYMTFERCPQGHLAERDVASAACSACAREGCRRAYAQNAGQRREYVRLYRVQNPEYGRLHRERNRGQYTAKEAKRRAAKLKRTPPWADLGAIKRFYEGCPKGFHVDHIYPLQGKLVSGLHVLENLQYLPAKLNMSKGSSDPLDFACRDSL